MDIYGCNLYQRYLRKRQVRHVKRISKVKAGLSSEDRLHLMTDEDDADIDETLDGSDDDYIGLEDASSVLVCTGVYNGSRDYQQPGLLNHNHRDFIMDPELRRPTMVAGNVLEAVQAIFRREGLS